MRHMIRGRQLSRDTEHRKSLRRSLVQSLFEHGRIRTTLAKAKEVKAMAEKMITMARAGTIAARRRVVATLRDRRLTDDNQEFILNERGRPTTLVQKLFSDIAPRFADRQGGYTRIVKLAEHRIGDGGDLVLLELVTEGTSPKGTIRRSAGLRRKRNERRHQFAAKVLKKDKAEAAEARTESQPAPEGQTTGDEPKAE